MEESPSPYRWFGYMFVWMLACLLLLQEGKVSELFIFILVISSNSAQWLLRI